MLASNEEERRKTSSGTIRGGSFKGDGNSIEIDRSSNASEEESYEK